MQRLLACALAIAAAQNYAPSDAAKTARAVAYSSSFASVLNDDKQTYDAAWVLVSLAEAVRRGALSEADARKVLKKTRYERKAFAAGGDDGSTDVIRYVRGVYDTDDVGKDLTRKSVGDHLSITAGLLTPLVWGDFLSIERAKSVVFDLQFVDDSTLGGSDALAFITTSPKKGLSFYRQVTESRPQRNSGGSTEADGWNPKNFRDANKVAWEDDVAMGVVTAAMLVQYHRDALSGAEARRIGDVLEGLAEGYGVFKASNHAYDFEREEASPVRWTRSIGWGLYGLALAKRTLESLGRDASTAERVLAKHVKKVLEWRDDNTGLWWQHADGAKEAPNFVETSGSALILAAIGELAKPSKAARAAFDGGIAGLLEYVDRDGAVRQCSSGSSIGAAPSYYFSRGVDDAEACDKAGLVLLALAYAAEGATCRDDAKTWRYKGMNCRNAAKKGKCKKKGKDKKTGKKSKGTDSCCKSCGDSSSSD